jgi:hypothetical protein
MLALRETIKSRLYLARVVDFSNRFDLCAPKVIAAKTHKSRENSKAENNATASFAEVAAG